MINIPNVRRYLLGCDLAKSLDYTSFAVIDMIWDPELWDFKYHLVGLDRIRGVSYPVIVKLIVDTIERLEAEDVKRGYAVDGPHLCMDASGLGAPIRDYLKESHAFEEGARTIYPVVFTGGESSRRDPKTGNFNISKTLIHSNFLSLMQHKRFDYAPDLQAIELLEEEIANFKYHLTPSGHITMDAVPGKHDDLISSVAIPLKIGEWRLNVGFK